MDDKFLYFIDILHRQLKKNGYICNRRYGLWESFVDKCHRNKLVCYGAGQAFSYFVDCYGSIFDIECVIDQKLSKTETKYKNISVKKKDVLKDYPDAVVLITVMSSIDEIADSLQTYGVKFDNIFSLAQMEYEKEDISNSLQRFYEDDLFQKLCSLSYEKFLMQRKFDKQIKSLSKRMTDYYQFVVHMNTMLNAVIDRLDDNEEMKMEQISEKYVRIHHNNYSPNLVNPKTFNEKILAMSLEAADNPLYSEVTDKYTFKKYVSDRIGEEYVVPLYGVWDSVDDIDFDILPDRFAIKSTNGGDSSRVILIKDKSKMDKNDILRRMSRWTNPYSNVYYYNFNGCYRNVPCRIIAEELLDIENVDIYDYKVHCFNGVPKLVHVVRQNPHQVSAFSADWEPCDYSFGYPVIKGMVNRPDEFDEMLKISKELSEPFKYVRVDFYLIKGKIYVGELTLTHMGGMSHMEPEYWDQKLGDMIE